MRINHNIAALNTYRQLTANTTNTSKSLEKLSSGLRINRAGDDAAGLAISEKMRSQIRGLDTASRNANDGISLIQTAEGALNETHSILQRMKELAVQASNDTNTAADRAEIQKEIDQLTTEISRIAENTEFNTKKLLDGSMSSKANVTDGLNGVGVAVSPGTPLVSGTYNVSIDYTKGQKASGISVSGTYTGADDVSATFDGTSWIKDGTDGETIELEGLAIEGAVVGDKISVKAAGAFKVDFVEGAEKITDNPQITVAAGDYTLTYVEDDGGKWVDGADEVSLEDYGLAFDGEPENGATIKVEISQDPSSFSVTPMDAVESSVEVTVTDGLGGNVSSTAFEFSFADSVETGELTGTVTVDSSKAMIFHIGANEGQNTSLTINNMDAESLNVDALNLTEQATADEAITTIDNAISKVSSQRAALGAMQNRLEHTINNLGTASENLSAAEARIRDVDMAQEMMEFTKNNILSQASQAMLAQANMQPQSVLQLLQ